MKKIYIVMLIIFIFFCFGFIAHGIELSDYSGIWKATHIVQNDIKVPTWLVEKDMQIEIDSVTVYLTSEFMNMDHSPRTLLFDGNKLKSNDDDSYIEICCNEDDGSLILSIQTPDNKIINFKLQREENEASKENEAEEDNKEEPSNNDNTSYRKSEDGYIVFDSFGLRINVVDHISTKSLFGSHYIIIEAITMNSTDIPMRIDIDNTSINGWQVSNDGNYTDPVKPGLKKKNTYQLSLDDASISSYDDIKSISFSFVIRNGNTNEDMYETAIMSFTFS